MNHHTQMIVKKIISRKAVVIFLSIISIAAFASLGDGKRSDKAKRSLLSNKSGIQSNRFSLKSGYNFKGNQVINLNTPSYMNSSTVVSFRKGHTTYVLPMKNKILEKVSFNPNAATRKGY
jgi:hypothetical protein